MDRSAHSDGVANIRRFLFTPGDLRQTKLEGAAEIASLELRSGMTLIVEPRKTSTHSEFESTALTNCITLDGRVSAPPLFDLNKLWWNADHHMRVDRQEMPCTAQQIYLGITTRKTLPFLQSAQSYSISILVNDCDLDVVLAIWQLKNFEKIDESTDNGRMQRLVELEDRIDRSAGVLGIEPASELTRMMAWINQPYAEARSSGRLCMLTGFEMAEIITQMLDRIDQYHLGNAQQVDLDTSYRDLELGGSNWSMVREVGYYARGQMLQDGIESFASVTERRSGGYSYSIWNISDNRHLPIPVICRVLNALEGISEEDGDSWGGCERGIGSPRRAGTPINPEQMRNIINAVCEFVRTHGEPFNGDIFLRFVDSIRPLLEKLH